MTLHIQLHRKGLTYWFLGSSKLHTLHVLLVPLDHSCMQQACLVARKEWLTFTIELLNSWAVEWYWGLTNGTLLLQALQALGCLGGVGQRVGL